MADLSERGEICEKVGATSMAQNGSNIVIICFWRRAIVGDSGLNVDRLVM